MRRARPALGLALCLALGVATSCGGEHASEPSRHGRLLVLGVDGASLRVIEPLLAEGRLPHLARLAGEGASGPLRSFPPLYSPRVWNSIATGKPPEQHGIKGFSYRDEAGREQLYLSFHRKAHALWNITSDAGRSTVVINWWNTYPPEKISGVMVSDHAMPRRVAQLNNLSGAETPSAPGSTVWPPDWQRRVDALYQERTSLTEIEDPFLGNVGIVRWMAKELLSRYYADDAAAARIALEVEATLRPDVMLLLLPGIDRVSHSLWGALEPDDLYPEALQLTPRQREAAADALKDYYRYTDALIGLLLERYGDDDLVLVLSDHGFEAGEGERFLSGTHDSEAAQDGILFASGPGIQPGSNTSGTTIHDITPTLLAWLGLPVAGDMAGRVASFVTLDSAATQIASYDDGAPVERLATGASGGEEAILDQLRALGYLEAEPDPSSDTP